MILWVLIILAVILSISLFSVLFLNYDPECSIFAWIFGESAYLATKVLYIAAFILFFPIFIFEGFSWLRLLLFVIGAVPLIISLILFFAAIFTEKRLQKINKYLDGFDERWLRRNQKINNFFDKLDTRLIKWQENSNARHERMEGKLVGWQEKTNARYEKIEGKLVRWQENSNRFFNKLDDKYIVKSIARIENKIQKIERKKRIHFFDKIKLSVYKFQIKYGKPSSHTPSTSN